MSGSHASQASLIQIGIVGRPHGVRGGFYLEQATDPEALKTGLLVSIEQRSFTVEIRAGDASRPIVTLREIGEREKVAELRGAAVLADRSDLTPLADGEWYFSDLIGLAVQGGDGTSIGMVTGVLNAPSVDVLEVETDDHQALLLPMVAAAIVAIEPAGGTITVDKTFLDLG